jgi:hypothetical protein
MHKNLGDFLLQYAKNSKSSILLVAPFIKASIIAKILAVIPDNIILKIVSRWIPDEIIAGVSDLEVWLLLKSHPNSTLYLCQNLHAKYYRFDDRCLVGSANLTAQALSWKSQCNLELLLPFSIKDDSLIEFEQEVFLQSFRVTDEIYHEYFNLVEEIKEEFSKIIYLREDNANIYDSWFPSLRNPEELYLAYSGQLNSLTTMGKELASRDLITLNIIPGLSLKAFQKYVALHLKQTKIVRTLDNYLDRPRRFGEMRKEISNFLLKENIDLDSSYVWQTLMRWLIYFLPDYYSYKVFNYSEVFYRHKK